MPSQRRTPRGGPGGTTRPGERAPRQRSPLPAAARPAAGSGSATGEEPAGRRPHRSRLTGRAAVLVLVLAVLTVSYASSLRAYLQQRAHIGDLKVQIAEREASINALEREKRRWEDPAFVRAQARSRFGYLMPGETGFQVLGPDGEPLESEAELHDPDEVIATEPTAWWSAAWESMELAGNPPAPQQVPERLVDGTTKERGAQ